jgi:hypothetical protein
MDGAEEVQVAVDVVVVLAVVEDKAEAVAEEVEDVVEVAAAEVDVADDAMIIDVWCILYFICFTFLI